MIDQEVQGWADVIKDYPEAAWGAGICGAVSFLAINFAWWLIELPNLVNGHRDALLLAAFAGCLEMVLFDAVYGVWAWRWAHRVLVTTHSMGNDDEKA